MLQNSIAGKNKYHIDSFEGNFIFLTSKPFSRFDGFFVKLNNSWFRTVSFMNNLKDVQCFKQGFFCSAKNSDIFLDCKEIFDDREWGRNYEIFEEDDCLIIKFNKINNEKESAGKEFSLFLVFKGDFVFSKINNWVKHDYFFDKNRNSGPFSRFVLNLGKIDGNFCIAAEFSKENAVKKARAINNDLDKLSAQKNYKLVSFANNIKAPKKFFKSGFSASKSLLSLHYGDCFITGVPWFVNPWARDELISAKALFLLARKSFCSNIIFKWLAELNGLELNSPLGLISDSWWTFFRALEVFDSLNELEKRKLRKILDVNLKKIKLTDGIIVNQHSTWMDTLDRKGAVEINMLVLAACKLAEKLGIKNFGNELKENVRQKFFKDNILKDCFDNETIRPNIFIAYYIYPELLSKKEWEIVFDNSLKKLWLSWGGLSTVDKKSRLFHKKHTGELSDSYHNGDSWFWINNLAAIVLHRLNKKKYSKFINKITAASAKEILKLGAINHHAELSDANKLTSQGCLSQAWSNALFVELMFELNK